MDSIEPKHTIIKVGHLNENGEPVDFLFDGSKSYAAAIESDGMCVKYGGYTKGELMQIIADHHKES